MKRIDFILLFLTVIICGTINGYLINENKPKTIKSDFLCKQSFEIKSKFNVVLECARLEK